MTLYEPGELLLLLVVRLMLGMLVGGGAVDVMMMMSPFQHCSHPETTSLPGSMRRMRMRMFNGKCGGTVACPSAHHLSSTYHPIILMMIKLNQLFTFTKAAIS
jgi:hypothetical protein